MVNIYHIIKIDNLYQPWGCPHECMIVLVWIDRDRQHAYILNRAKDIRSRLLNLPLEL